MNLEDALQLATVLSEEVRGTTDPNPPVGCVILDAAGEVVGKGATAPAGGPHAEVVALRSVNSEDTGVTAVTTLEPCNHAGLTGPCSVALIEAGIIQVHYGAADPNPSAAGGACRLREAGVVVSTAALDPVPLQEWLVQQRASHP